MRLVQINLIKAPNVGAVIESGSDGEAFFVSIVDMYGVKVVVHFIKGYCGRLSKYLALSKRDVSVDGVTVNRPCKVGI